MKISNKITILLLSVMLPIGFVGCSDDESIAEPGGSNLPEFVLEQDSIRVKIGTENKVKVNIKQGGGEYGAFVLDKSIAAVELEGDAIEVEGFANGQTSLVISDKYSRYSRVAVSVYTTDVLRLSHEQIDLVTPLGIMRKGKASVLLGNGEYKAVSDNSAVTVSVDRAGEITFSAISAKEEFTANVTVTDCTGLSASIVVKVQATMDPYSEDELQAIMADNKRVYSFNDEQNFFQLYGKFVNETLEDGKFRYGWYYGYGANIYASYYLDFKGNKEVGTKESAWFSYYYQHYDFENQPVTFKIIKNDGKNLWGVFSYVNEEQTKLRFGYFCDTIEKE